MAEIRSTGTQSRGTFAVNLAKATHGARCTAVMHHIKSKLPKLHQRPFGFATVFFRAEHGPGTTETPSSGFPSYQYYIINTIRYSYSPTATIFNKLYRRGVSAC